MIDNKIVIKIINLMSYEISSKSEYLDNLDREIGDGEHGSSMKRGFNAIKENMSDFEGMTPGEIFMKVGEILTFNIGGAAGPLYGTAFMEAGKIFKEKKELNKEDLIEMIECSLKGIKNRGKANLGDKTMIDTLEPALENLKLSYLKTKNWKISLNAMIDGAKKGMGSTAEMAALKGRSSYLGDRSKGVIDPGAASMYILLKAIYDILIDL